MSENTQEANVTAAIEMSIRMPRVAIYIAQFMGINNGKPCQTIVFALNGKQKMIAAPGAVYEALLESNIQECAIPEIDGEPIFKTLTANTTPLFGIKDRKGGFPNLFFYSCVEESEEKLE